MLTITIPRQEAFNPETNEFSYLEPVELQFESTLLTLSKWEAKWRIHFIGNQKLTPEQVLDYIKIMTVNGPFDDAVYNALTKDDIEKIAKYLGDTPTATTITQRPGSKKGQNRVITSELIYAWMAILRIPYIPCETWNLNRLLILITATSVEQEPPTKMDRKTAMSQQRSLNAARRARLHSKG